ncbi:MAG TPA: hypothetical protein VHL80_09075, partial [Polyangia bacterium]|nr:hypothetical protein [Polyangia bacterium]
VARDGRPALPPPAARDLAVHIRLQSRPPHARVVDVATSEIWGTTPLDLERPPAAHDVTLRLERPRFEPALITIAGDRDLARTVELRPRREAGGPADEPPAPTSPPAADKPRSEPVKL